MFTPDQIKAWFQNSVPKAARSQVAAYVLQLAIAEEIRAQAERSGATPQVMDMAKTSAPFLVAHLRGYLD